MAKAMLSKREIEQEILRLQEQEETIDNQLCEFFTSLAGRTAASSSGTRQGDSTLSFASKSKAKGGFEGADLNSNCQKIAKFAPCFEAMAQDARKLGSQVEDCRILSDRISAIVRRLDNIQMKAQQSLACTEDIINLKDCRIKIQSAIEDGNLAAAVGFIKQVHDMDMHAVHASDDFVAIQAAENQLKDMVKLQFDNAIAENNITHVMSMCPLLQTLGLEVIARDSFLDFIENTVFCVVSADAAVESSDPSTAYAQALSNIFNSTYSIFQQYLPIVIQGMENSLGDVHFIRRMHARCEHEAAVVLKRYIKFRNLRDIISSLKTAKHPTLAEMHVILDEVALLLQYCSLYSKYLSQLCSGAESRVRAPRPDRRPSLSQSATTLAETIVVLPPGGSQFHRMIEEVINHMYMVGEQWIMEQGMKSVLPQSVDVSLEDNNGLDECFFVLRRCGQRAIATNNIQVACAILQSISNLLSSNLFNQVTDLVNTAIERVVATAQEHCAKYCKTGAANQQGGSGLGSGSSSSAMGSEGFSLGIKNAMNIVISAGATATATAAKGVKSSAHDDDLSKADLSNESDPYGLANVLQSFNIIELCFRYTERLTKEIHKTGVAVFAQSYAQPSTPSAKGSTSDADRLQLSCESLETSKLSFQQVLKRAGERLATKLQPLIKDFIQTSLGRNGPLGGIRFDIADDKFDVQPALVVLPRALVAPIELLITVCTTSLSETNKDIIVGFLADAVCERLEHFVSQSRFRFAGALKCEECIRAVSAAFVQASSTPIRSKFARMREIMLVLTSDVSSINSASGLLLDATSLSNQDVLAYLSLRADYQE